jgi:hypothetical protein
MTIEIGSHTTTFYAGDMLLLGLLWLLLMILFVGIVRAIRAEHAKKPR